MTLETVTCSGPESQSGETGEAAGEDGVAKRDLREDEATLWRMVVRDIKPLKSSRTPHRMMPVAKTEPPALMPEAARSTPVVSRRSFVSVQPKKPVSRPAELAVGVRAPGLDDTSWKRLSRGQMKVDARLDLHGYVVQEAFERLYDFMQRARVRNWRCIEIVTGLGSGQTSGLIRRELPLWLQRGDLRSMVLAVVHPHAANHGSVRILLKTRRR
ncbi:Smr/MutS family protein [Gluconobacter aidae]|uniref:DNA mismatch repair protein MutS n=1 Tax=Gluconobacter aidae TaxID=2662454 RepID=A0A7X1VN84_9PROT|nr:Smr/MutS family protein [Gluconobacter aidae]MQR98471.1 DNA mismatch repair protein MutS [Gluconobacter aidae]